MRPRGAAPSPATIRPMAAAEIEEARGLDAEQLQAIADLEQRVVSHDGGRLKLEWDALRQRAAHQVQDVLAWDGRSLVGFCGIYQFGAEPEIAGAVDPAHRRRGIGSALLDRALALLGERSCPSVLLVAPRAGESGRRFAAARGAPFHHAEHHMALDGPPAGPPPARPSTEGLVVRPATEADRTAVASILEEAFGPGASSFDAAGPHEVALVVERAATVVGGLRLSLEGDAAGVYGLAVRSSERGKGIGRAALYEVCLEARRRGASKVTLEVEVDNDRALGLYTSVGFERRTTEEYFQLGV